MASIFSVKACNTEILYGIDSASSNWNCEVGLMLIHYVGLWKVPMIAYSDWKYEADICLKLWGCCG